MEKRKDIEQIMDEALVDKPTEFTLELTREKKNIWGKTRRKTYKRKYVLYPPTMGKIRALSALLRDIEIDEQALAADPMKEGLRIAEEYTPKVAEVIATALRNTKAEITDKAGIEKDAKFLLWNARPESMATLLLIAIAQSDFQSLVSLIRLSKTIWMPKEDTGKKEKGRTKGRTNLSR